jgi:PAS domain S-box-containing protein
MLLKFCIPNPVLSFLIITAIVFFNTEKISCQSDNSFRYNLYYEIAPSNIADRSVNDTFILCTDNLPAETSPQAAFTLPVSVTFAALMFLLAVFALISRKKLRKILQKAINERANELEKELEKRNRAEVNLKESEKVYKYLFEHNPQSMWIYDIESLKFLAVNKAAVKQYGYSPGEFLSMTVNDIRPKDDIVNFSEKVLKSEDELRKNSGWRHLRKNGEVMFVEVSSHKIDFEGHNARLVLSNDITEQKFAKEALQASEEEYRNLFKNASDSIIIFEPEKEIILEVNAEACKVYGYEKEEFVGKSLRDLAADAGTEENKIGEIIKKGSIRDFETRHKTKNGNVINLLINASGIEYKSKPAIMAICRNITERRRIQEALEETEIKLREFLEHNTNLYYTHDANQVLTYVSPQAIEFLGCGAEEAKVRWTEFITDNPINLQGIAITEKAIKTGKAQPSYELELRKKNGELIWVEVNEAPIVKDGITTAIVGSLKNITERKKMEDKLKQSEEYYRTFTDILPQTVFEIDPTGRITFSNKTGLDTFGYSPEEFEKGLNVIQMIKYDDRKRALLNINRIFQGAKSENNEYAAVKKDGTEFPVLIFSSPIYKNNQPVGLRGIVLDITERKRAENLIKESNEKFRLIANATNDGIWEWNVLSGEVWWNDNFCRQFGLNSAVTPNFEIWVESIHPDDRDRIVNSFHRILDSESDYWIEEFRRILPDGSVGYILDRGYIQRNGLGKPVRILGSTTDLTGLKKAEEVLRTNQLFLSNALEIANMGPWEYDLISDRFTFNDHFYKMLRTSVEEAGGYAMSPGEYAARFMHPDDAHLLQEETHKAIHTSDPNFYNELEHRVIFGDGAVGTIVVRYNIIKDSDGKTIKIIGVNQDITARKMAEEKLQESENRYRKIFEEHSAVKLLIDPETLYIIDANEAATIFYGWTRDELTKKRIDDISLVPKSSINSTIANMLSKNQPRLVVKHKLANGTIRDVEIYSSNIELQGKILIHSIIHDITERKKAEEKIRTLSSAIEQSPVSVIITDPHGNIQYVNGKFSAISGYALDEVINRNPRILKSDLQTKDFYKNLWDTILSGKVWRGEMQNKKKNGDLYWEDAIISPIYGERGITNFVAVKEDITQRKRMIEEIIIAKENAEEASRLKSNFLANMSHELRTPLIGILGYAQILSEEIREKDKLEMIESINYSGQRLLDTVNLILDLSRIEQNKYEINHSVIEIDKLARQVLKQFIPVIQQKGIAIEISIENGIKLYSDENALTSILNNLMSNAVKYTEKGSISLIIDKNNVDGKDHVIISLKDTGIGISEDKLGLIFEEFRQVSEGYNRKYQGAGLGLTITKKIVAQLGGRIEVDSEINKGTTFRVRIPLHPDMQKIKPVEQTNRVKSGNINTGDRNKILVLEDDELSIKIVQKFLEKKYDVRACSNIYDALNIIRKENFDAFLIDINLSSNLTGIDFLNELKINTEFAGKPFIAVTAYSMKGDREKLLGEGFTHYISKPFMRNDILKLLDEALEQKTAVA